MAASGKDATNTCQAGQAALAARLLKRISTETKATDNNLVFSPLSIHVALALMSTAAAGDTLDEILRVAGAPSREELAAFVRATVVDRVLADQSGIGGPSILFACGTWTDKKWPLRPAYVDAIVGTFKGNSWAVDFKNEPKESRKHINAWVAKATRNLITKVLNPEEKNPNTVHVVANAIYFYSREIGATLSTRRTRSTASSTAWTGARWKCPSCRAGPTSTSPAMRGSRCSSCPTRG